MDLLKKLAVIGAGVAIGEFAWLNFVAPMVAKATSGGSGDGFGLDDVARFGSYAAGVIVIQKLL